MKNFLIIILSIVSININYSQNCTQCASLQGRVTDDLGDGAAFANVGLYQSEVLIQGTETDLDGFYEFKNLQPGIYDLEATYVGLNPDRIKNVKLIANQMLRLNLNLSKGVNLSETCVVSYKTPRTRRECTSSSSIVTGKRAKNLPIKNITGIAATTAGATNSGSTNTRGARSESTVFILDGVITKGELPPQSQNGPSEIPDDFNYVKKNSTSTFSIDADGASYAISRRYIQDLNQLPPKEMVRIEEWLNYFDLNYSYVPSEHPISFDSELVQCPWDYDRHILRVGIEGAPASHYPDLKNNFVFLIDVSGSMSGNDRLALLKEGFLKMLDHLNPEDKVAIVTYAGIAGVALKSTEVRNRQQIEQAIRGLGAGGSTAGEGGIRMAYTIAQENFISEGNNRIILGTDGDFNVGISNTESLLKLIEKKRASGIYLTVLGVGMGNHKDHRLEQIANHGNGTYEYIDSPDELLRVFVEGQNKFNSVVKDVKIQVVFNKKVVSAYKLIGYENRILEKKDFKDDKKDAGEIGADQNITALYEVVFKENTPSRRERVCELKIRYKEPNKHKSQELKEMVFRNSVPFDQSTEASRFSIALVGLSKLLAQDQEGSFGSSLNVVKTWISNAREYDPYNRRAELIELIDIMSDWNSVGLTD